MRFCVSRLNRETRLTDRAERETYFAKELEWVAERLRAGRAGEQEIESLLNVVNTIRGFTTPSSTEEVVVARFLAARDAEKVAATEMSAFFWPLVRECKTETEARDLMHRVPNAVDKAFMMDHFVYVSKVIPKVAA